ncbi:group III truncated hemoglobin [uncultured Halovibrio sp.]|uniref:group III truncated hemoglobin n=1 Tax=uncultured Halovibrio sp. TaxID=985049 RepID=UPI0025E95100|nr:group III truncated hemoglobin [uncultured Halovibrio sp.]
MDQRPQSDLNTPEAIHYLVQIFYDRLLNDPIMAPVFLETAGVNLDHHLPTIEAYWRKMLLGERGVYTQNMIAKHEAVHAKQPLEPEHFERWGAHFHATVRELFEGPYADKAHRVADRILINLQTWLLDSQG